MGRGKKRGKKTIGGVGGQPPAAGDWERGAEEAMDEGKGQELVMAGGELARGDGRRVLTALEFQGWAAVRTYKDPALHLDTAALPYPAVWA
jgi:hypothetical protein